MDYYSNYDTYSYTTTSTATSAATGAMLVVSLIFSLVAVVASVLMIIGLWKVFTKAGKPGWAAIVPIYNLITLLEIVGRPAWWVLLTFVPFANLYVVIMVAIDLAKAFGKSGGFAALLILLPPVGYMMLGFDKSAYAGPVAAMQPAYPGAPAYQPSQPQPSAQPAQAPAQGDSGQPQPPQAK